MWCKTRSQNLDPLGCPSIRTKALSRHTFSQQCFRHRVVARGGGGPKLWKPHGESSSGERIVPPPIDPAQTAAMILLSESRCASGRERPINPSVWGLPPGAPASCSRHERSLDTAFACAASSRVVQPISVPRPPWPRLSACRDGNGANIPALAADRSAPRPAPPRPAAFS